MTVLVINKNFIFLYPTQESLSYILEAIAQIVKIIIWMVETTPQATGIMLLECIKVAIL